MGPANFTCPEVKIDFRIGGSYRAMITSPAHGENWFGGVYREIVENKRLVFTFTWDNDGPSAGVETLSRSPSKRRAARPCRPSTKGPSSMSSAATATWAAGPRPSTSLRLMPRRSQRSTAHDYDLGIQMGSGVRLRTSARSARALGLGGGGHPLQDAPSAAGRSGQAGLPRPAALRTGADSSRWRLHPVRIRGYRALHR